MKVTKDQSKPFPECVKESQCTKIVRKVVEKIYAFFQSIVDWFHNIYLNVNNFYRFSKEVDKLELEIFRIFTL